MTGEESNLEITNSNEEESFFPSFKKSEKPGVWREAKFSGAIVYLTEAAGRLRKEDSEAFREMLKVIVQRFKLSLAKLNKTLVSIWGA